MGTITVHKRSVWIGISMVLCVAAVMSIYFEKAWPAAYVTTRVGSQDVVINRFTGEVKYHDSAVQSQPVAKAYISDVELALLDFSWASDTSPQVKLDVYNKSEHDISGTCLFHIEIRDIRGSVKCDRQLEVAVSVPAHNIQHGVIADIGLQFDTDRDAFAWNMETPGHASKFDPASDYTRVNLPKVSEFYFTKSTSKEHILTLLNEIPEANAALTRLASASARQKSSKSTTIANKNTTTLARHDSLEAKGSMSGTTSARKVDPPSDYGTGSDTKTISIGSTQAHVKAVMGPPTSMLGSGDSAWWYYGYDLVRFEDGKVASYSNDHGRLPIR